MLSRYISLSHISVTLHNYFYQIDSLEIRFSICLTFHVLSFDVGAHMSLQPFIPCALSNHTPLFFHPLSESRQVNSPISYPLHLSSVYLLSIESSHPSFPNSSLFHFKYNSPFGFHCIEIFAAHTMVFSPSFCIMTFLISPVFSSSVRRYFPSSKVM